MTCNLVKVLPDMGQVRGDEYSLKISSPLALTVWTKQCFEDIFFTNDDSVNESVTKMFVEQPWLQLVYLPG